MGTKLYYTAAPFDRRLGVLDERSTTHNNLTESTDRSHVLRNTPKSPKHQCSSVKAKFHWNQFLLTSS